MTCEVAPHHWTLTDEAVAEFDTNMKMSPPLRSRDHVQALLAGLQDGTIDAIATDHAPHHADEKALEFDEAPFGITGLETAIGLAFDLVQSGRNRSRAVGNTLLDKSGAHIWTCRIEEVSTPALMRILRFWIPPANGYLTLRFKIQEP